MQTISVGGTAGLPNLAKPDYESRVNRVIDFVLQNLAAPLELDRLAQIANFSPFHFHRIFKALMGETLSDFVRRVRLQRAIQMMSFRRTTRLTDIALACGFASSSDFSRSFKQHYGVAPSAFDLAAHRDAHRAGFTPGMARLPSGLNPDGFKISLRRVSSQFVAYIRVSDCYSNRAGESPIQRVQQWAEQRGFAQGQWLGYMWDDPEVVPREQCRYDLGVRIPHRIQAEGEICCIEFPPMTLATVEMYGGIDLELRAIDWFYGTWLPASGYVPDEQPCFEAFVGRPFAHGNEYFELQLQFPVVKCDMA